MRELEQAWCGPGGLFGPVAWAFAYQHAAKRMPPELHRAARERAGAQVQ